MCGKCLLVPLSACTNLRAIAVLFLFVSENRGVEWRQGLAHLLLLGGYSDLTGNWEAFPHCFGTEVLHSVVSEQLLLSVHIDALRASWVKDSLVMCSMTGLPGCPSGGWALVSALANMKQWLQCGAASRQEQARCFWGFSFLGCAVTSRPKGFIRIIFIFLLNQMYEGWPSRLSLRAYDTLFPCHKGQAAFGSCGQWQ